VSAFFGGMLGAAGSWLLIPALMTVFGLPLTLAAALAAVAAPIVGLSGYFGHALGGAFNIPLLVPMSVAALGGALAGMLFSSKRKSARTRLSGSVLLGIIGVLFLLRLADLL